MYHLLWVIVLIEAGVIGMLVFDSINFKRVWDLSIRKIGELEVMVAKESARADRLSWRIRNLEHETGTDVYEDPLDPFMAGGLADELRSIKTRRSNQPPGHGEHST